MFERMEVVDAESCWRTERAAWRTAKDCPGAEVVANNDSIRSGSVS